MIHVASKQIHRKGIANLGLVQHTVLGEDRPLLRMIEKRVRNSSSNEIAICEQLRQLTREGNTVRLGPLPWVHGVIPRTDYTSIYMPYYKGCGKKTKNPQRYGQIIADALRDLAAAPLRLPRSNALITELLDACRMVLPSWAAVRQPRYFRLHGKVVALSAGLLRHIVALPVVISHNDLKTDNVCIVKRKSEVTVKLIDLGFMAPNFAGADLRHLLRRSFKDAYWRVAYEEALVRYAGFVHCTPEQLSAAAHTFAMLKWLRVIRNGVAANLAADALNEMLRQGEGLYGSAQVVRHALEAPAR